MAHEPRICEKCGRSFLPPYRVKRAYWAGRRFCSAECRQAGMAGQPRSTFGKRRVPLIECFWSKVDKRTEDECWPWIGAREGGGYGYLFLSRTGKPSEKAHRLSWIIHNGPIPDGLFVCHRCDNRPCCNPAHLFLGTAGDNNRDRGNKGRGKDQRGERNTAAKLSDLDVEEIRRCAAEGMTQQALADWFDMSQQQISRIVRKVSRWSE